MTQSDPIIKAEVAGIGFTSAEPPSYDECLHTDQAVPPPQGLQGYPMPTVQNQPPVYYAPGPAYPATMDPAYPPVPPGEQH